MACRCQVLVVRKLTHSCPGASAGEVDATCVPIQIGLRLRGKRITPWRGGRSHSVFVHKKWNAGFCRFETKMRQNAPNPISISICFRHWWLCPRPPGRGGKEGKGQGEGKGREREREGEEKGKEGKGKGRGKFASLPLGGGQTPLLLSAACSVVLPPPTSLSYFYHLFLQ